MQYDQSTGMIYLFDTDSLALEKSNLFFFFFAAFFLVKPSQEIRPGGTANPWAISPQWLRINIGDVQVFCRSEISWGEGEGGNIGGSLLVIVIWLVVVSSIFYFHPYLNWRWSNLTSIFFWGGWNHQLVIDLHAGLWIYIWECIDAKKAYVDFWFYDETESNDIESYSLHICINDEGSASSRWRGVTDLWCWNDFMSWCHQLVSSFITRLTSNLVFLAPPKQVASPPTQKNGPPISVTTISGDAQKRPFRTVADWARPHTPLTLDPRSKVGTSTVTTLPEIWFPQCWREIPKKAGPFVMISKELALMVRWHVKGILTHWFAYDIRIVVLAVEGSLACLREDLVVSMVWDVIQNSKKM